VAIVWLWEFGNFSKQTSKTSSWIFDFEKRNPNFFVQKKNTTYLWQMGPCFEIDWLLLNSNFFFFFFLSVCLGLQISDLIWR
jgi:hypothetical protein